MTKTDTTSSYGLYLQSVRVEKGISIERVAQETRIRVEILRSIEAEDHDNLPNDVFVKGFLRSFATAVGADPEEVLRRFATRRQTQSTVDVRPRREPETERPGWWKLIWVTAVMVGLIGGTLLVYQLTYQESHHAAPPTPDTGEQADVGAAEQPANPADVKAEAEETVLEASSPPAKAPERSVNYLLEIVSHEDTWLKVIADDARATEHSLKAGDTLQLEADTTFNVLIGNAGGVTIQLNGQPVPLSGKSGQVVNLQLP
jgi:cytoskeletal protein RodZ